MSQIKYFYQDVLKYRKASDTSILNWNLMNMEEIKMTEVAKENAVMRSW